MPSDFATFPLTSSQLALWLGQQLVPTSPLYNMAMTIRLPKGVAVARFQRAWQGLVAENDALRLRFKMVNGTPSQFLGDTNPELSVIDLKHLSAAELAAWLTKRTQRLFDLASSPVDAALLLTADGLVWYLNQHHLITDAWGIKAQFQRMSEIYASLEIGAGDEGLPLPLFLEYASDVPVEPKARTLAYWQEVGNSLPALADFNAYTSSLTTSSQRVKIEVKPQLRQLILAAVSKPKLRTWTPQLTKFNLIATALLAFLHRLTGQERLAIGTPAHNRITAEHKRTPGVFMELFPLAVEVSAQDTFVSLYERVRDANYNFLRFAQPGANNPQLARGFNVVLNFIDTPFGEFAGEPVAVDWIHPQQADASHHLRLLVYNFKEDGAPEFCFELNEAIFSPQQREIIPKLFSQFFQRLLEDPDHLVSAWPLLEGMFPESPVRYPEFNYNATLLDLWEEMPDVGQWTLKQGEYGVSASDLVERVNRLASYLLAQGVERGDLVPVVLNRTPDYVVSILAILKSGAAFVPIPVSNPVGRVTRLLAEANAQIVLSHTKYDHLTKASQSEVIKLDQRWEEISHQPVRSDQLASRRVSSKDLAYVLYTSGSTGTPKGVMITHRALSLYLQYARRHYPGKLPVTAPLFTSVGFDLTITATFLPLITAGTLWCYPLEEQGPDLALFDVLRDSTVNFLKLTPAHLLLLSEVKRQLPRIETLVVGGENFSTGAAKIAQRIFPNAAIYNEYGPTEATVGCVVHRYLPEEDTGASVPIGNSMPFVGALVLDAHRNPVPDGVVGQLFLEGETLARGYFQRQDLTEASFQTVAGRRVYATGDLVVRNPESGQLVYYGRADEQLKIGGQRVEPDEVTRALEQQAGIDGAVVVMSSRVGATDADRLLAYVTGSVHIDLSRLLTALRQELPLHMIPQRIIRVERFPLNANGKLDYGALPLPTEQTDPLTAEYREPRDEFDGLISTIWSSVFDRESISISANFFDLGGDSLKGIRIVSLLNDELELELPVNLLFRHPTIMMFNTIPNSLKVPLKITSHLRVWYAS
ncbi:MAG: amino acid adenylation domain-containing protein [Bacteroidota bacterium]